MNSGLHGFYLMAIAGLLLPLSSGELAEPPLDKPCLEGEGYHAAQAESRVHPAVERIA